MNATELERLIEAVLYEGYVLYPYRPSSKKNQRERFTFGRIYPQAYSAAQNGAEPCLMQTECLVQALGPEAAVQIEVRFLQPMLREVGLVRSGAEDNGKLDYRLVPELRIGTERYQTWQEAFERRIELPELSLGNETGVMQRHSFNFEASRELEPLREASGRVAGVFVRSREAINGTIELAAEPAGAGLCKVRVLIRNLSPLPAESLALPDGLLLRVFASTHTLLRSMDASFVSAFAPPAEFKSASAKCQNIGSWPVLVGSEENSERDTMLSSPIILYDYPKLAPESPNPLFDGTEIDEILSLRILTLTDEEKHEASLADNFARQLLERTASLGEDQLLKMHGTMRQPSTAGSLNGDSLHSTTSSQKETTTGAGNGAPVEFDDFFAGRPALKNITVDGVTLKVGDQVRLCPKGRADVMDLALAGQTATIEALEEDIEHRVQVAVVLDQDPGRDLGFLRQPGHRFFFRVDELELLTPQPS